MQRSRKSKTGTAFCQVSIRLAMALVMAMVLATPASAQQQCSDSQFVQRAFGDLLFRGPDSAALSFYTPLVASAGRQAVAASITGSHEYAANLVGGNPTVVAGLYQKFLGRNPNSGDVTFWIGKEPIKDGTIIATLMGASEYRTRATLLNPAIALTNSKLLNQMFLDLLGRNATNGELTFYGTQLGQGTTVSQVATNIMATDEYYTRIVQPAFQRMLHRAATSSEVTFYVAALKTSSRPDEDLLNALAGSGEYCNGSVQSPTFGFVAASDVLPVLNTPTIPANVDQLPAVQFGPVDAAANAAILMLGAQAAAADSTIASLQNELSALQQQVSTAAATINDLQSQLTGLQQQAATDAATISALQGQVASLQQQATADAATISSLQSQVTPLQQQVTSLQQQLSAASNTINTLQGQVTTLQGQVTPLQQQVAADASTISSLNAQIAALSAQLSGVGGTIAAQEQTIFDVASSLLGQSPTKDVAMAAGAVAQARVSHASGNGALLRLAQSALAKGNASITSGDYAGAVRDFRLAYLLAGNTSKHE